MKHTFTIAILLLLLTTSTVFAQSDITLSDVWTTVQGMQADFTILGRELRLIKDRTDTIETQLSELASEPFLIGGEKCLILRRNNPQNHTFSKYVDTFGHEPPHMEHLRLQSVYYDTKSDTILLYFTESYSRPTRYVYEFWHKCEFAGSSEWQEYD